MYKLRIINNINAKNILEDFLIYDNTFFLVYDNSIDDYNQQNNTQSQISELKSMLEKLVEQTLVMLNLLTQPIGYNHKEWTFYV